MKLIGNLLLTICLITGCLSAATAYMSRTADDANVGLTLSENSGAIPATDDARAELRRDYDAGDLTAQAYVAATESSDPVVASAQDGETLTDEQLAALRDADVEFVHTKEFSVGRWPYAWVFGLSAAGLLAGSLLVRAGDKAEIAKHAGEETDAGPATTAAPDQLMRDITAGMQKLSDSLAAMPSDQDRLKAIMNDLGELQNDQIPSFIESRPQIIAAFSLGGYAEIMDRFAGMERQINRAWSAAADGHYPEASSSLSAALSLAPGVQEKL